MGSDRSGRAHEVRTALLQYRPRRRTRSRHRSGAGGRGSRIRVALDRRAHRGPEGYESAYPYSPDGKMAGGANDFPLPDPLIWMAYVAAATTRIKLATGIIILPQHNPVITAKQVATLDHLSGGRVILGIGVGWLEEEFRALGVPFEDRGRRTDEYVAAMRELWSADPTDLPWRVRPLRRRALPAATGARHGADRGRRPLRGGGTTRRPAGRRVLPGARRAGRADRAGASHR